MIQPRLLELIVSDPNLYNYDPYVWEVSNVLSREAYLTEFRKLINLCYLDLKSHYPVTIATRNTAKETLFGKIFEITTLDGKPLKTTNKKFKDSENYKEHLGEVTLAMANHDIVSYGSKTMNLPTLEEIGSIVYQYDSPPIHEPKRIPKISIPIKKLKKLVSVLAKVNRAKFTKTDANAEHPDNGLFFFNNGMARYMGTLVQYIYHGDDLITYSMREQDILYSQDITIPFYGKAFKGELISLNENINKNRREPFDMSDLTFKTIRPDFYEELSNNVRFAEKMIIDEGLTIMAIDLSFYYPLIKKMKQITSTKAVDETGMKDCFVTDLEYRYRRLKETTIVEFRYFVKYLAINLEIRQQMQIVNLD